MAKQRGRGKHPGSDRSQADHYSRRARREGYPARSVYKLQEIQQKFQLIGAQDRVLDLGAAPGSWTTYLLRVLGPRGSVVAVDLSPLNIGADERLETLQFDITADDFPDIIASRGPFTVVVSDAAPSTSGGRILDTARSAALVESVVAWLPQYLAPDGNLALKIFQGGEEQQLLRELRLRFRQARAFKPQACRSESFETYLIGLGYRPEGALKEGRRPEEQRPAKDGGSSSAGTDEES